jgi:hypothetical protein
MGLILYSIKFLIKKRIKGKIYVFKK